MNDDCNGATLRIDETSSNNLQLQNLSSSQNKCNTYPILQSTLPQMYSPSKPSSHPAMVFIQDEQTGALCNSNYFIAPFARPYNAATLSAYHAAINGDSVMKLKNFVAPIDPTAAFATPHHQLPTNADVMNGGNHPIAYCSNGQGI